MSRKARQGALLAALAVVLVIAVWRQLAPGWARGSTRAGTSFTAGGASRNPGAGPTPWELPRVEELRLAELQRSPGQYSPGRDPFRFAEVEPVQPAVDEQAAAIRKALLEAQAKQPEIPPADTSPPPPAPPPVDVVFLGSFGPRDRRLAVFSDGSDIFNALEGDVLKQKFVVERIGYESADLGFVGFPEAPAQRLEIGG